jgi:thioredoxin-related protein
MDFLYFCIMKIFNGLLLVLVLIVFHSASGRKERFETQESDNKLYWHSDLMKAHEASEKSKKPIFAFFTGSDWCGWCHKLQREVFAKPEFVQWANSNVVLLELDFPRFKQLPTRLAQQNQSLQQQFRVEGYPTVWLFTTAKGQNNAFNITPLGSLGYPSGAEKGKEEVLFLKNARQIMANQKK